jgi:hypothetical protein
MTLPLTPQRLAATYECLRVFPPFNRWKLPPASEVRFHVTRHKDRQADFYHDGRDHIRVSAHFVGRFDALAQAIAHEMVHQHVGGYTHGSEFKRAARSICRRFGWDEKLF